jgi:hypothetical protein
VPNETALANLDSRIGDGTDIGFGIETRDSIYQSISTSAITSTPSISYPTQRKVRVIIGFLGPMIRLSAKDLNLMVEGTNFIEAWSSFRELVYKREDSPFLTFDVDRLRPEEISQALDVPEDEDWSGLLIDAEN